MRRRGGKGRGERRVWKEEGKKRGLRRRKGRNEKEEKDEEEGAMAENEERKGMRERR